MTSSGNPTVPMTVDEMVATLTGFDELAIEKHFDGFDIYAEAEHKGVRAIRALAFVQFRRDGKNDREALREAQELPFKVLMAFFADPEPEIDPEQPETPSGKGSMSAA